MILRAEQAMYDLLALRYPRVVAKLTVEAMRAAREQTAAAYPQMRHDFSFLRMQTLRDHAREFGYAEKMAEEAFEVFIQARNEVDLYDDVLPALEELRSHYRLFTASNGNADLGKIGLAHYFERSIAARHVGALKPDPAIFHKVIEGTDLELDEVAYVGDDPELDIVGARRAGMQADLGQSGGQRLAGASTSVRDRALVGCWQSEQNWQPLLTFDSVATSGSASGDIRKFSSLRPIALTPRLA